MEKKEFIIDTEKTLSNPEKTMAFFWVDIDANEFVWKDDHYKKIEGLRFLREIGDDRIEIFKDKERMLVISAEYYDDLKKIFDNLGVGSDLEYFIVKKDSPIIFKSGVICGIIAPRVEGDW